MSSASMSFGRPARLDFNPFLHVLATIGHAVMSAPRRWDAWLEQRAQARMTAEDVLALARSIEDSDPGFAADLRGAALRATEDR